MSQAMDMLSSQSYGLAVGLGLLVMSARLRSGALSVGDLSLFVTYATSVATAGSWLGGDLAQWGQYGVSLRRLLELVPGHSARALAEPRPVLLERDLPAPPSLAPAEPFQSLRAVGLTCSGRGVRGVDLELQPGELVVVTGRIGSGKTTLLRGLLGLLPLTSGWISWNGREVDDAATFMVPPRCGYVSQQPLLVSGTLRENLAFGLSPQVLDVEVALRDVALEADLARLPAGMDTTVGRHGVRLSGGQIQRVAAARVLARRPQVAVIDDLSSALDVATEAGVWERLRARSSMACLAVSHRRAALRMADRIVVLREGRVEDAGSLAALLGRCAEMRALWRDDAIESELGPER
jgi:ATP-binding cassette subfamily B protein